MNYRNTAFYSTANSGYLQYAVTSLLTIRNYIPDAHLSILGSGATEYEHALMSENDINFIELDLTDRFTKTWDYPVECYYIFAGPEQLHDKGYEYSVYIDGDILCGGDPLEGLADVDCIAGVASSRVDGKTIGIFGDDWPKLRSLYDIPSEREKRDRINAGVVYFNNKKMQELDLLNKSVDVYNECLENNIPRKGDDSLFSLLQMIFLDDKDFDYLGSEYNYVLQFNTDWSMPVENLKFFHFSIDKPWKEDPYQHSDSRLDVFNPYVKEWRSKFLSVTGEEKIQSLEKETRHLKERLSQIEGSRAWKVARTLQKISPNNIARKLRGYRRDSLRLPGRIRNRNSSVDIKAWYWIAWDFYGPGKNMFNFGDVCTVDIVREVFGFNLVWTPIDKCEFIGTGSIIQVAQKESASNEINVWGSGFIDEGTNEGLDNLNFFAVRGESTRERIGKGVVVGDPGILASLVYGDPGVKTGKIGVIMHYKDGDLPIVKLLKDDDRFHIISPLDPPARVAQEIAGCRLILSSSLHGLIFADSYKVPNAWIQPSDGVDGGSYKFEDYCSGVGKRLVKADIDQIFNQSYLEALIRDYKPIGVRKIQRRLIKAFPYK